MAWLVIAALLLAAALQGIGYYQQTALTYQAKSDLSGEHSWAAGRVSLTGAVPTGADLQAALDSGDLKLSKSGGTPDTGFIASTGGSSYCIGVQSPALSGNNVFYSSSNSPTNIQRAASLTDPALTANCGTASTATAAASTSTGPTPTPTPTPTVAAAPKASFTTNVTTGTAPLAVNFTDTSTGSPTSWAWDFGDGATSTSQNPSHTYAAAGTYTAKLTASNAGGSNSSTVSIAPTHAFTAVTVSSLSNSPANTSSNGNGNYYGMASSSDGSILVAASNNTSDNYNSTGGYLYRSTDSGASWTQLTAAGKHSWIGVASSGNGQYILAVDHNPLVSGGGYVYLSTDGGQTWTANPGTSTSTDATSGKLGQHNWIGAAMSHSGQYMMVTGDNSGHIWWSSDYGQHWSDAPLASEWQSVSVSDDGQTMAATSATSQQFWVSVNGGAVWSQQGNAVSANWESIAVSGDGKTILAGMRNNGCLEVGTRSTANGTTGFTYTMLGMGGNNPNVPSDNNYHVFLSADGTKALALGQNGNHVLTSVNLRANPGTTADPTWPNFGTVTDGGYSTAKFTNQSPSNQQWWSGAVSSDGSKLAFASISGSPIYTGLWN